MNPSNLSPYTLGHANVNLSLQENVQMLAVTTTSNRHSRDPTVHKIGSAMRVVKPRSTNNSPRKSGSTCRRMTDGAYMRRMALLEDGIRYQLPLVTNNTAQTQQRLPTNRPFSWHPSTGTTSMQSSHWSSSPAVHYDHMSPMIYSSYASPITAFTSAQRSYAMYEHKQQALVPQQHYNNSLSVPQTQVSVRAYGYQTPSVLYDEDSASRPQHWSYITSHGGEESSTTPPTPAGPMPVQHPEPAFQEDDSPFRPLSDVDDGEELIGLGLYDPPDIKSSHSDPQLNNYHALVAAHMMGTPCRQSEPTGKGLKLEETWAPPSMADSEESDSDQDGYGEEEEDNLVAKIETTTGFGSVRIRSPIHQYAAQNPGAFSDQTSQWF